MKSHDEIRLEVIDRLVDYVVQKLPPQEAPLIKNFIRQYYLSVSPEDLVSRNIMDLYGAVLSHWHYIIERMPGEAKVRVYNPELEQHGWQSTHTVIEIGFDDMPFLVDSISIALNRMELNIHLIIHMGNIQVKRNKDGHIIDVREREVFTENGKHEKDWTTEAAIYVEIDRQSDKEVLQKITENLKEVMHDVRMVVEDWPAMRKEAQNLVDELRKKSLPVSKEELDEVLTFLEWMIDDHFTFMSYREYKVIPLEQDWIFQTIPDSSLGIVKKTGVQIEERRFSDLVPEAQQAIISSSLLLLGKTNKRSNVHRPAYTDFVTIKLYDDQGRLVGGKQFTGLYTSVAYNSSPLHIPYLRRKVTSILRQAGFPPRSHDDRTLLNILETFPRDDLFQGTEHDLLNLGISILHLQERQRIRLFIRKDVFGLFYSCLVFVPRDNYTTDMREKMQEILMRGLGGRTVEFSTRFSESTLARIHFVIRVDPKALIEFDARLLERELIEIGRTWYEDLMVALVETCGEEKGNELYKRYEKAFSAGYTETFLPRVAVVDIEYFDKLSEKRPLLTSLYRPLEDPEDTVRFKLFRINVTIPLSDVVPILENMGLRIISERPYEISSKKSPTIWINDYRMVYTHGPVFNTEAVRESFQEAFEKIWNNEAENDGFNRLVLSAKLSWREISLIRALAKYLWQTGFTISQQSVEAAFFTNSEIATDLVQLFNLQFNPDYKASELEISAQRQKITDSLDKVSSLTEDRILRRYMETILAIVRTNYYQVDKSNHHARSYLAFKFLCERVPELPLPKPLYEIFVYSPRVEGIHLRAAKVARGGIRWSDRREDFRTEVLGLMKAQQVKNAVIVPMGSKGGFVVKRPPENASRDQMTEEVIYCYKTFMCGLLDLTDNIKEGNVVSPERMVRYDEADPYLVVAADKGTATFSDIANSISKEHDFWLEDAFASGGKTGYDHKKMAITSRGAFESVKRHFQELGLDPMEEDFTVMGIGDMSGDVFGNGMLRTEHIKLIAAFNHIHIFLDPNPDPILSFRERERLFNLPRSSWEDYNPELISKGGGVYSRSLKSIALSKEIQDALDFHEERVQPNDLIRAILKAPVTLFWNGGIGTYVKSTEESQQAAGDRANDAVRVNGADLRCLAVAEGGNLGFTQYGRIEYAKKGGKINTDAIDNSGGVNCSDYEVNIKILLNEAVENGDLTEKQRNLLLAEMEEEVAGFVLYNNRRQTEAISVAVSAAPEALQMQSRVMQELSKVGDLDCELECLPTQEELVSRKAKNIGLTRPEIAVLMAYTKIYLKKSLLSSELPDDDYVKKELIFAFPKPLQERFESYIYRHRLRREIIATRISNAVVNEMGITFISRLQDETGAQVADIVRGYEASRVIFKAGLLRTAISALGKTVDANILLKMMHEINRLVRRGTRWFLRNRPANLNIEEAILEFEAGVEEVSNILPNLLAETGYSANELTKEYQEAMVPEELARQMGLLEPMFSALDIVEAALLHKFPIAEVAHTYYAIGLELKLGWFRDLIKIQPVSSHWEALARASFRDDLDREQRNLAISILRMNGPKKEGQTRIEKWMKKHHYFIDRWNFLLMELKNSPDLNYTIFSVALRELIDLAMATMHRKKSS